MKQRLQVSRTCHGALAATHSNVGDLVHCLLMWDDTDTAESKLPFSCVCGINHYTCFKKGGERNLLYHVCSMIFSWPFRI